jgi:hypothetical protein
MGPTDLIRIILGIGPILTTIGSSLKVEITLLRDFLQWGTKKEVFFIL